MGYSPWSSKELDMTEGLSLSWCVEVPKFCITKYVFLPFMVSAVYVLVCQLSPPPPPASVFLFGISLLTSCLPSVFISQPPESSIHAWCEVRE